MTPRSARGPSYGRTSENCAEVATGRTLTSPKRGPAGVHRRARAGDQAALPALDDVVVAVDEPEPDPEDPVPDDESGLEAVVEVFEPPSLLAVAALSVPAGFSGLSFEPSLAPSLAPSLPAPLRLSVR